MLPNLGLHIFVLHNTYLNLNIPRHLSIIVSISIATDKNLCSQKNLQLNHLHEEGLHFHQPNGFILHGSSSTGYDRDPGLRWLDSTLQLCSYTVAILQAMIVILV